MFAIWIAWLLTTEQGPPHSFTCFYLSFSWFPTENFKFKRSSLRRDAETDNRYTWLDRRSILSMRRPNGNGMVSSRTLQSMMNVVFHEWTTSLTAILALPLCINSNAHCTIWSRRLDSFHLAVDCTDYTCQMKSSTGCKVLLSLCLWLVHVGRDSPWKAVILLKRASRYMSALAFIHLDRSDPPTTWPESGYSTYSKAGRVAGSLTAFTVTSHFPTSVQTDSQRTQSLNGQLHLLKEIVIGTLQSAPFTKNIHPARFRAGWERTVWGNVRHRCWMLWPATCGIPPYFYRRVIDRLRSPKSKPRASVLKPFAEQ